MEPPLLRAITNLKNWGIFWEGLASNWNPSTYTQTHLNGIWKHLKGDYFKSHSRCYPGTGAPLSSQLWGHIRALKLPFGITRWCAKPLLMHRGPLGIREWHFKPSPFAPHTLFKGLLTCTSWTFTSHTVRQRCHFLLWMLAADWTTAAFIWTITRVISGNVKITSCWAIKKNCGFSGRTQRQK